MFQLRLMLELVKVGLMPNSSNVMVIGLTGGIGSGKSTIAKVFAELGATIIDLDSLGHEVLKNNSIVREKLIYSFGAGIINEKGEIERSRLGRLVFANPGYLMQLNSIVHPPLIELADQRIKFGLTRNEIVVLDAALLIECNMTGMTDAVVLIYASEDTQLQRLIERGFSAEDALGRIRAQMKFEEKRIYADYIIDNNSSLNEAIKQTNDIWKQIIGKL